MKEVRNYNSNDVLNKEIKYLFEHFYHFGCHKNDIKQNGNYVILKINNKEIVIYNDNMKYIVFDNICPHRGASLFCDTKKEGCSSIKCPYHGWSYSNGKLFIPNKSTFEADEIKDIDLSKYKVEFCGDFLFFSKYPKSTLIEQLDTYYDTLSSISSSIEKNRDLNTTPFKCNWKISLENALENYHVPYIHETTLAPMNLSNGTIEFDKYNSIWISDIENKKLFKKLTKMKDLFHNDIYKKDKYFSLYLFPFSMISSTFGLSYAFQSFFPGSTNTTDFHSRTYSVKSDINTDVFYDSVIKVNRQIFNEDIVVCNSLQKAAENSDINFVYSKLESRILNFQDNYNKNMEI